jgi:hypothetical protein
MTRIRRAFIKIMREIVELLCAILLELLQKTNRYSIHIKQETSMSIGNITAGTTGQFGATLLDNGTLYETPAGSTYIFTPSFTASDPTVTFAPATVDESGGTILLEDQVVVTVPGGDLETSVTITATATAPDGTMATGSVTVTLTPAPQKFTIAVTQVA